MSEYQRYEFMTSDRPLTRPQLDEVRNLSSHIEASSTHALIEYHWGDFKHDPLDVLYRYFDGFLYWANWGSHQVAFRLPHGSLSANLLDGYDFDELVTFTRHPDFDILDIQFGEMEGPDEWTEYELEPLMPLREELLEGDQRPLYIVWLAALHLFGSYNEEEVYDVGAPPAPPGLGAVTSAQQALAALLRLPEEILAAAARHSAPARPTAPPTDDDFAAWIQLMPSERRTDYLVRLAQNEPGLSHLFVRELRALRPNQISDAPPVGERMTFATLHAESEAIKAQLERERRERKQRARERQLRQIYDHQDECWQRITEAVERGSGAGYDQATQLLLELREAVNQFGESRQFEERFRGWVRPHLQRPAFVKRLQDRKLPLPEA